MVCVCVGGGGGGGFVNVWSVQSCGVTGVRWGNKIQELSNLFAKPKHINRLKKQR